MKRLTLVLLSFGVGANIPSEWLMSLPLWKTVVFLLGAGTVITAITEWAYRPRNNN